MYFGHSVPWLSPTLKGRSLPPGHNALLFSTSDWGSGKGDVGSVMGVVATGMMGVGVSGVGWVQVLCGCQRGRWQSYGCGGNGDDGCGG